MHMTSLEFFEYVGIPLVLALVPFESPVAKDERVTQIWTNAKHTLLSTALDFRLLASACVVRMHPGPQREGPGRGTVFFIIKNGRRSG